MKNKVSLLYVLFFFIVFSTYMVGVIIKGDIFNAYWVYPLIGLVGFFLTLSVVALERKINKMQEIPNYIPQQQPIIEKEIVEPEEKKNEPLEIANYIVENSKQGIPIEIILSTLKKTGHNESLINSVLKQLIDNKVLINPEKEEEKPEPIEIVKAEKTKKTKKKKTFKCKICQSDFDEEIKLKTHFGIEHAAAIEM